MYRLLALSLTVALPALAQLAPCADDAATRRIVPLHSVAVDVQQVPDDVALAARNGWRAHTYGDRRVPEGWALSALVAARVFRLPKQTFYLIRVKDEQSLFSRACPLMRCSPDVWLRSEDTILVDRARPPRGRSDDEFYVHYATDPTRAVTLLAPDPFSEEYRLSVRCTLVLQEKTR